MSEGDLDLLDVLLGVVRTNSLGYGNVNGLCKGHASFPMFSLLCHSCMSNCRYTAAEESNENQVVVQVRALKTIPVGQELTVQYKNPLLGNWPARCGAYQANWLFTCTCERCLDPTEMGTFLSGVRCFKLCDSQNGYLLPMMDDNEEGLVQWTCQNCSKIESTFEVDNFVESYSLKIQSLAFLDPLEDWENLLAEMSDKLHPNHYLAMDVKRVLIQLYGSRPDLRLKDLSVEQLERKLSMCRNYVDVYDKVDSGYSKWRGRVLEELSGPMVLLAKKKHKLGQIEKAQYDREVAKGLMLLKSALKCRQYEFQDPKVQFSALIKEFNDIVDG